MIVNLYNIFRFCNKLVHKHFLIHKHLSKEVVNREENLKLNKVKQIDFKTLKPGGLTDKMTKRVFSIVIAGSLVGLLPSVVAKVDVEGKKVVEMVRNRQAGLLRWRKAIKGGCL